ncbi:MAG: NUDIX hydrolase [Pseudomonadota bacterium]
MHRRKLLALLDEYEESFPEEVRVTERFRTFVENEPRCFDRDCWTPGHVTGSAWLVDPARKRLLLTHHKKLNMWLQLGGHSDSDPDTARVALKEAEEESGVAVTLLSPSILDIDIHEIPARKDDPAHYHFDVRFCVGALSTDVSISDESHNLAWIEIDRVETYTTEESILRMRDKWSAKVLTI